MDNTYYMKNRERLKESNKLRYHLNKYHFKEYYSEYYAMNKDVILLERAIKNFKKTKLKQIKTNVEPYKPTIIDGKITVQFGFR